VYNEPVFPSVSQVEFEDGQQQGGGAFSKSKTLDNHKTLKGVLNQNHDERRGTFLYSQINGSKIQIWLISNNWLQEFASLTLELPVQTLSDMIMFSSQMGWLRVTSNNGWCLTLQWLPNQKTCLLHAQTMPFLQYVCRLFHPVTGKMKSLGNCVERSVKFCTKNCAELKLWLPDSTYCSEKTSTCPNVSSYRQ